MIRKNSQLLKYLPADYCDTFSKTISNKDDITPVQLIDRLFVDFPWWVNLLMKLRNLLVKPFGLKNGKLKDYISNMIKSQSEHEVVVGMTDKHLDFYVEFWCSAKENNTQHIAIATVVKYNNMVGRMYFFFVKPFHKLILRYFINQL